MSQSGENETKSFFECQLLQFEGKTTVTYWECTFVATVSRKSREEWMHETNGIFLKYAFQYITVPGPGCGIFWGSAEGFRP